MGTASWSQPDAPSWPSADLGDKTLKTALQINLELQDNSPLFCSYALPHLHHL